MGTNTHRFNLNSIHEEVVATQHCTERCNLLQIAHELLSPLRSSGLWHSVRQTCLRRSWRSTRRLVRNFWQWAYPRPVTLPDMERIRESIAAIEASSSNTSKQEPDTEAPIFVLASGWRTGSTLLQRILVTDPDVLLWGEPLGDLGLLSNIAEMLAQASSFRKLRRCAIAETPASSSLAVSWIFPHQARTFARPFECWWMAGWAGRL